MTEAESISLFVREVADRARSLPLSQATAFLRGCLTLVGDVEAVCDLSRQYVLLHQADSQLDLIASGQLKLNLGGREA